MLWIILRRFGYSICNNVYLNDSDKHQILWSFEAFGVREFIKEKENQEKSNELILYLTYRDWKCMLKKRLVGTYKDNKKTNIIFDQHQFSRSIIHKLNSLIELKKTTTLMQFQDEKWVEQKSELWLTAKVHLPF